MTWPKQQGVALLVSLLFASGAGAAVKAYRSQMEIPTYPWWPAVKHPYFRGTDKVNIYPYPMQDQLNRAPASRVWRTVVLENEYLRVTFLPELGGKVQEVWDKTAGAPVFYVNHVVKPGLIGQCGAWVSGGIEFNTGPAGHTVSAVLPVTVEPLPPGPDGSRSVAVGEVERIYGTRWTVVVTLRPGRSFLEETVRIYNLSETVRPYYFWNCTAMPNTPGFRFIYPMTLGTDHSGKEFYTWPLADGKDLSCGTNYQDASSIFAYQCDQDFFGSYDTVAERGVVAYANHHQLVGKKAWTWGQGSFGAMHQMDLTDTDGPYNEVQTGPLPTQADVGRLEPHEAVGWTEWWYPVRRLGGFTFANRDLAANAEIAGGSLRLRLLGTGTWNPATVQVWHQGKVLVRTNSFLSPAQPADLKFSLGGKTEPFEVEVRTGAQTLARFRVPLDLPIRQPPKKKAGPQTAAEYVQAGWQDYLFAKFPEAEAQFRQALAQEAKNVAAHTGLAYCHLARDPAASLEAAGAALAVDPDHGPACLAQAYAQFRLGQEKSALDAAWAAALDPATAIAGRALAAKVLIRRRAWPEAIRSLSEPGPWQTDPVCRNRRAFACWQQGDLKTASQLAKASLAVEPLDTFARSLLWLLRDEPKSLDLGALLAGNAQPLLELAAEYAELDQPAIALQLLDDFYLKVPGSEPRNPLVWYWAAWLSNRLAPAEPESARPAGRPSIPNPSAASWLRQAQAASADYVFPYRLETEPVLRWALEVNPADGNAALFLGHLLFALGRQAEGRALWRQAAQLGAAPTVAWRALGMASLNVDHEPKAAAEWLRQAHAADPADVIVARDLARVIFTLADKEETPERNKALVIEVREVLKPAFATGRSRSDYVALLARAHNRLGEFAETARLLDTVRITVWEGAREAHDLFEEAHLVLGQAHLDAGRAAEALAEFNRALEYPRNLATGKLEKTCDAHIHALRGDALAALGQKAAAREAWKLAVHAPASKDTKKEAARQKAKAALEQTRAP